MRLPPRISTTRSFRTDARSSTSPIPRGASTVARFATIGIVARVHATLPGEALCEELAKQAVVHLARE